MAQPPATMFRWTREPDDKWIEALNRLTPHRSDRLSHLTIHWVPIATFRRAQRWVIFECVPLPFAGSLIAQLTEDAVEHDPLQRWAYHYALTHDAFPIPFWVCQGNPVGHPYAYNAVEKAQASTGRLPAQPPMIGELAYSEPTDLTWIAIRRRSNLNRKLASAAAHAALVKEKAQREARRTMLADVEAHLTDSVREAQSEILEHHAQYVDRRSSSKANVTDDHFAEYVETGRLPYLTD